jgi:peroxiredoxin Q/BCP
MEIPAMAKPLIGSTAPNFSVLDHTGKTVSLTDFTGKYVVLYFYPKALTSGCTVQACALRDTAKDFAKVSAVVLGVSPDEPKLLKKFVEKEGLNFTLLSDPEHQILEPYGVWVEKSMYGRKYMGAERSTFIIDPKGKIAAVFTKVDPKTHADEVLSWLKQQ